MPISVWVVDDEPIIHNTLRLVLERVGKMRVTGFFSSGEEVLAFAKAVEWPDIIIMDHDMPVMNGDTVTATLLKRNNKVRVLAYTGKVNKPVIQAMFKAGVSGFVAKGGCAQTVIKAIHSVVHNGCCYFCPKTSQIVFKDILGMNAPGTLLDSQNLSETDEKIIQALILGTPLEEIAHELAVTADEIEFQRQEIAQKIGISDVNSVRKFLGVEV